MDLVYQDDSCHKETDLEGTSECRHCEEAVGGDPSAGCCGRGVIPLQEAGGG